MSTRMSIVFIGANGYDGSGTQSTLLYQHCDGYPTNVLPSIFNALKAVRKKAETHWQSKFTRPSRQDDKDFDFFTVPLNSELLAGCYIAEETSGYGMGASFESTTYLETDIQAEWDAETAKKVFGNHGDIEWLYVVNAIDRSIKVYGGGYDGGWPADTAQKGTVDPLSYVENLTEDYQIAEAAVITKATRSLSRLGFPVNPKRQSGRRAAHAAQRTKLRQK
jgi:hypothetical protein